MDEKLAKLLEYIRQEIAPEPCSGLMPGGPVWQVEAIGLLDEIARIWGISKEAIGEIINGDIAVTPLGQKIIRDEHGNISQPDMSHLEAPRKGWPL